MEAGMLNRLRTDPKYRGRFIHSTCIFWTFLSMGMCYGMAGPTFPDLRQITRQDLATGSWLFTSSSVGFLVGSLLGGSFFAEYIYHIHKFTHVKNGVLYSRFNRLLLIGVAIAIFAVSMAAKPWCEWFPMMIVVGAVGSVTSGILNMGGNAEMVSIWDGEEGSMYMQALHFFFSIGGIISPLLAKPFLAPRTCVPFTAWNHTEEPTYIGMNITDDLNTTFSTGCYETFGETRIHTPYLITGIVMFSGYIPFLVMYVRSERNRTSAHDPDGKDNLQRPVKLPVKVKILLMTLLSAFMAFYWSVEDGFIAFLMTFCLRQLHWTKDYGSYASSSYWAAFSVGRFIGIFLARRFSSTCLLFTYTIFIIISFIGLLVGSITQNPILPWICIPLSGFAMSVVFPCIFTWTDTRIMRVTGMIASMFMVSGSGSAMVNPLVFGYMIDTYSPIWFVYLLLGEITMCLLLLGIIQMTVHSLLYSTQKRQDVDGQQELNSLQGTDATITA